MLDIKLLRDSPQVVKDGIAVKGAGPKLVDEFLRLDGEWRTFTANLDEKRALQNKLSKERNIEAAKKNKEEIKELESKLAATEKSREEILLQIPNLPDAAAPRGKSEAENKVLREVGKKPKFDFTPKDHLELGEALGIIDFETASRVSGSGFYYLKNDGVLLEFALVHYALDFLRSKGFDLWFTPDLAREKYYLGTGYNPRGPEAQTYLIENSDLGLVATSEVTLAGIHAGESFAAEALPKRYAGYSHCFRQEAGAYGKYSRGLYRVHQFTKVEMYVFTRPEDSAKMHEELLALEEELWQGLKVPYRVVEICTGDLGAQASRKFDLEAWMPGRNDWGEITSTSNTTDYQARRLNIRYKKGGEKPEFAHTLNGTAIATSRAIIAILENYQRKDGKVDVPKALEKYMGKKVIG
ncbi:MAG: serine--tRNA ligase [Patescibacteria group bacterium]